MSNSSKLIWILKQSVGTNQALIQVADLIYDKLDHSINATFLDLIKLLTL